MDLGCGPSGRSRDECLLWKQVWAIQSPASHTLNAATLTRLLIKDCTDDTTMPSPEIADIIKTLPENEQYLRAVADSAPDAVVSIHKRGTVTFAGKVAGIVFRYSFCEVMGKCASWVQSSLRQFLLNAERQEVTAFG